MFLGVDIGTSGVKAILTDHDCRILDQHTVALSVSRPQPLWSEQNPADWVQATLAAIDALQQKQPAALAAVRGIGLAGQMHGAVVLDADAHVIRPAILWNDGRCEEECRLLEQNVPQLRQITGNIAMPGFTAPKLLWLNRHEPKNFTKIKKVLLPKDYVRFVLTGEFFSDMSDAAGTLWLNVKERRWSDEMLAACGLSQANMPVLREGNEAAGTLKAEFAKRWNMTKPVLFCGGAGDNAAGAIGVGVLGSDAAFISLGTSGVYFVGTDEFHACPERTVHSFCHAVPNTWHQMGVILSAASCIKTAAGFLGAASDKELIETLTDENLSYTNSVIFLPYLSGERTPHNNPHATGSFFGLTHSTARADLVQAIMEGVAFAFADCQDALAAAGSRADQLMLIGGGARNKIWGRILASTLDREIVYVADGDQGPAFGAAKLAWMMISGENAKPFLEKNHINHSVKPDPQLKNYLRPKLEKYRRLYSQLVTLF